MSQLSVAYVLGGAPGYLQRPQCVGCAVRTHSGGNVLVRAAHPTASGPFTPSGQAERDTLLGHGHEKALIIRAFSTAIASSLRSHALGQAVHKQQQVLVGLEDFGRSLSG
jgi:hypothetical protein